MVIFEEYAKLYFLKEPELSLDRGIDLRLAKPILSKEYLLLVLIDLYLIAKGSVLA